MGHQVRDSIVSICAEIEAAHGRILGHLDTALQCAVASGATCVTSDVLTAIEPEHDTAAAINEFCQA